MGSRIRVTLVVLAAATLAAGFSTSLAHQSEQASGHEPILWRLVFLNATFWYLWAVLAYPLARLSRRLRVERRPHLAVPVHIAAILGAAVAHVAAQTLSQVCVLRYSPPEYVAPALATLDWTAQWATLFPRQLYMLIDWELFAGAGIVAFAHACFYYREAQERSVHEAQLEARLLEAQLQMLQRQLHPHFLFNTLHAISTLMHRDVQAADRMLMQLSDLLRLTLDSISRPEIRLNEELEFLDKYVQIEQVRLGDRLTVRFDVEPDALDATVPALILQPLVENAIKHGIAPYSRSGQVTIGARRQGEMLIMTVDDTGPGPSERALAALSTGIGVSNTRARLVHQFGAEFRFEFRRRPGGFSVLVGIPFRREAGALSPAHVA